MKEKNGVQEIMKVLKKRAFFIFSIVVVITGITAGINYYLLPDIYEAHTQILVNQKSTGQESDTWSRNESDLQLIDTYNVIIKSPAILDRVVDGLDMKMNSEELANKITVSHQENSKVVNIIVEDPDSKQVVKIANNVATVFKEEITSLMDVDNINILSPAIERENPKPIKPRKILNVAIAAVVSLLSAIGLSFLIEIFDTTIKNENDIETISNIPIIGFISPFEIEKKASHIARGR
ncbi:capsular biosynthesis protein [Ureibacillus chungkukjangi]|uniref:YveK family protein n=1 Tax=Ureibacillus chungkukjangi TaxID=1202712 RepID=UPI00384D585D